MGQLPLFTDEALELPMSTCLCLREKIISGHLLCTGAHAFRPLWKFFTGLMRLCMTGTLSESDWLFRPQWSEGAGGVNIPEDCMGAGIWREFCYKENAPLLQYAFTFKKRKWGDQSRQTRFKTLWAGSCLWLAWHRAYLLINMNLELVRWTTRHWYSSFDQPDHLRRKSWDWWKVLNPLRSMVNL